MLLPKYTKISLIAVISAVANVSLAAPTTTQLEAARDKSLAYLIQHQNGDGSWGSSPQEKVRLTSAALDALNKYEINGLVYRRGINWLANADTYSTDSLARKMTSLARAGITSDKNTSQLMERATVFNGVKTWGPLNDYQFSTIDMVLALQALYTSAPSIDISDELEFIQSRRNPYPETSSAGGGWGPTDQTYGKISKSKVYPTAQFLLAYSEIGGDYWLSKSARKGTLWLAMQQKPTGAISEWDQEAPLITALSVQVFGEAIKVPGAYSTVFTAYDLGLDYLVSRQAADGSLDNNLFATALAAQAWFNTPQTLSDSDGDGIPDSVEGVIGTNPNTADTDYLEPGNGDHYDDRAGSTHIFHEAMVNQADLLVLDTTEGTMWISSGELPPGMTFNSSNKTLTGTPTQVGNYAFSYIISKPDGTGLIGNVMVRVADRYSDLDHDGIAIYYEKMYSSILNNLDANDALLDSDGDGLTNLEEFQFQSNPTLGDSDGDGLLDIVEREFGSNPNSADSDNDGLPDEYEYEYLNELNPNINDADIDMDNDGLTNIEEYQLGLPPNNPDFDGDGLLDGEDPDPFFNPAVLVPILYLLTNG
ncbi:putative Ig domain-containing protein [Hahella ganghwensis]|uniref:putative Ig domain-containing protein n=1 Tax=Hahella ganghwensis TaxID=286420 RepID=UPI0003689A5B|nr:putative Ig domain-containing protein [Hahella ganghwensis]